MNIKVLNYILGIYRGKAFIRMERSYERNKAFFRNNTKDKKKLLEKSS